MTLFSDIMEFDSKAERLAADLARVTKERDLLLEACKEADRILWMAKEYAEAGGSGGPEMRDYTEAETAISAALAAAEKGGE